eukprot:3764709-Rhodomonas_salina.2
MLTSGYLSRLTSGYPSRLTSGWDRRSHRAVTHYRTSHSTVPYLSTTLPIAPHPISVPRFPTTIPPCHRLYARAMPCPASTERMMVFIYYAVSAADLAYAATRSSSRG